MTPWLRIRRNRAPFYHWTPSLVVKTILDRASRDTALDYDQAYSIGRKAAQKYSGNWSHTLQAALPWQSAHWSDKGCRMRRGDWNAGWVLRIEARARRLDRIAEEVNSMLADSTKEALLEGRPYSCTNSKSVINYSYHDRVNHFRGRELFLWSEIGDRCEIFDFSRLQACKSCEKVGSSKKVRYYSAYSADKGIWHGHLCVSCWNRIKPIWKAEKEYLDTKKLINKLDKERLIWQRSQTQVS